MGIAKEVKIRVVIDGKTFFEGTTETSQPRDIDSFIKEAAAWAVRERKRNCDYFGRCVLPKGHTGPHKEETTLVKVKFERKKK